MEDKEKSKRDIILERLKVKYPDGKFEDDEAIFSQVNDDYDSYEREVAGLKEKDDAIAGFFNSDPRSAAFFMDWKNGEDPTIGLIRKFGIEIKDVLDNPDMQEQIAEANKEYLDRVSQNEALEEAYQANMEESLSVIRTLQEEKGYSDKEIDQAFGWLIQTIQDGVVGKFSPEIVEMAMKAQNYDNDVAQAEAEGEVKGRNARIEEKLRTRAKGDGMATLDGKNGGGSVPPAPELGAIGRFGDGTQNIWERGGERRTRYK